MTLRSTFFLDVIVQLQEEKNETVETLYIPANLFILDQKLINLMVIKKIDS